MLRVQNVPPQANMEARNNLWSTRAGTSILMCVFELGVHAVMSKNE